MILLKALKAQLLVGILMNKNTCLQFLILGVKLRKSGEGGFG